MDEEEVIQEQLGESVEEQIEPDVQQKMPTDATGAMPPGEGSGSDATINKYFPNVEITDANRSDLEDAAKKLEHYEKIKGVQREIAALFNAEPDLAQAFIDYRNGEDFFVALSKYIDFDSVKPVEGEPNYEKYQENVSSRMKRLEEIEGKTQKRQSNEQKSIEVLKQFKADNNMSDEDFDKFFTSVAQILDAAFDGELTVDLLEAMYYRMNRDTELESARSMGEVAGKNAKISTLKQKSMDLETGDGLPDLNGGSMANQKPMAKPMITPRKEFRV